MTRYSTQQLTPKLLSLLLFSCLSFYASFSYASFSASFSAAGARQSCTSDGRPLFGYLEIATLVNINQQKVESLVDSGATTTALDARNIRMHIKRNGARWVYYDFIHKSSGQKTPMHQPVSRVARIITHKGPPSERAVVRNTIKVGKITRFVDTSLISRSNFPQQLLIGRNFLKNTALIDSGGKFLQENCQ